LFARAASRRTTGYRDERADRRSAPIPAQSNPVSANAGLATPARSIPAQSIPGRSMIEVSSVFTGVEILDV
jgi:hypothetical protein